MTEKRFTITRDFEEHHRQIRDNGHIIMGCFVELQAEVIVDKLNELAEENKELQEQNNRQAKQLDNIYNLIEKQDWETLTGLIQEFKECEEQLKIEMECYE